MIGWTIEAAKKSRYLDRIIVSTDGAKIAALAKRCGAEVPFLRPPRLAGDRALVADAVLYTIDRMEKDAGIKWEYLILLQPTSPLRTGKDIDAAIDAFFSNGKSDALLSIAEVSENPYAMLVVAKDGSFKNLLPVAKEFQRRQDLPKIYKMNGALYICKVDVLRKEKTFYPKKTMAFIMPKERSIDIDTAADLELAEHNMRKRNKGASI